MRRYPNRDDVNRVLRTIRVLRSKDELRRMTGLSPELIDGALKALMATHRAEPVYIVGRPVMWRAVDDR